VDVKYLSQMSDEDHRQYLFAAIDRATRWVYVERLQDKSIDCRVRCADRWDVVAIWPVKTVG